jgi:hypothetical protein
MKQDVNEWAKRVNIKIINSSGYSLDNFVASFEEESNVNNVKIIELIKSGQLPSLIDETVNSFKNFYEILTFIENTFLPRSLVKNKERKLVFLMENQKGDDFIIKFTFKDDHFIFRIEKFPNLIELMRYPNGNIYNHSHKIFFVAPE